MYISTVIFPEENKFYTNLYYVIAFTKLVPCLLASQVPSSKSPGFTNRHDCCGSSAVILRGNLGGCCLATTLHYRNTCLILVVIDAACRNKMVSV